MLTYSDELAAEVGCGLNMGQLAMRSPTLVMRLLFGPNYPFVYRLCGEHTWSGATAAIASADRRIRRPLYTRKVSVGKLHLHGIVLTIPLSISACLFPR